MASNSVLEQLKEETSESKLVGLLREVLQANTNDAKTALLARLNTIGKEPSASCKVNREIRYIAILFHRNVVQNYNYILFLLKR